MRSNEGNFSNNLLIKLKDQKFLHNQRIAGKITAKTLILLENLVKEKTQLSLIELNNIAEKYIRDNGGIPTFLNYKGFPASVCISVNKTLVHGIPNDYQLQDGDLVSFDLGVTIGGSIADSAITCIFGEPKDINHVKLVQATKEALKLSINTVKVGKNLGMIGHTIYQHARKNNFSVVEKYGGHGICIDHNGNGIPHAQPFVSNKSEMHDGIIIQPNLTIAIEPLFVLGNSNKTTTLNDGWSVVCENLTAHEEHTIFIHENEVEVITSRENIDGKNYI